MSVYPREWHGSTEQADKTGEAVFKVEGQEYRMRLESFTDFQTVEEMLDAAFQSGKHFAAVAMRSHVVAALDKAERDHAL